MPRKRKPLRPGPKPRGPLASQPIAFRATDDERARFIAAAEQQGQTLSDWAREACEMAVARGSTR